MLRTLRVGFLGCERVDEDQFENWPNSDFFPRTVHMIIIQACNLQPTQLPSSHRPINLQLTVKCNVPEGWVGSLKTLTNFRLLFLQKKDVPNIIKICNRSFLPSQSSLPIRPTEIVYLRASKPSDAAVSWAAQRQENHLSSFIRHQGFLQGWG